MLFPGKGEISMHLPDALTIRDMFLGNLDLQLTIDFCLRLLLSCVCGGAIGIERSRHFKEAGVRTHIIVCMGAALAMIVSKYGFADLALENGSYFPGTKETDPARVAAQVISGISFLGAGVIFKREGLVRGLTTAAGIWVVSAIGLASGAGMFWIAAAAAVMAVVCLEALHYVMRSSDRHQMRIRFTAGTEAAVQSVLQRFSRDLDSYSIEREDGAFRGTITLRINTRDYAGLFLTATRDLEGITLDKIEPVEE